MRRVILKYSICLLLVSVGLTSCKKKSDPVPAQETTEQPEDISDENSVGEESESTENDANIAQTFAANSSSRISADPLIAGATIDTTHLKDMHKLVINYDGKTNVNKRMRSGSLAVQLIHGNSWKEAGAVLKLTYDYKVTWANKKSWTFTGTKTITNVSGGTLKTLTGNLIHKISGNVKINFEDNTSRSWFFTRIKTLTFVGGNIMVSFQGDTTVNGVPNVDMGGVNRKGKAFFMQIQQPVLFTTQCNTVISGVRVYKGIEKEITVTYGVDAMGTPVNSCSAYGYKLTWTVSPGNIKQAVVSY